MRIIRSAASLVAVLLMGTAAVQAAELVIVESSNATHQPGQVLDADTALTLPAGTRLVLVSADGNTITLQGPFNGKPGAAAAEGAASGAVVKSLASLVTARDADTASLGAVRAAGTVKALPSPWLIDVANSGHACLEPGVAPVLWRPETAGAGELALSPADRSWTANTGWPAGSADLALPADVPFNDGEAYLFEMDGQAASVTLHMKPQAVQGERMVAAWMAAKGCDRQAQALLAKK